jgi:hypothetical protein
MWYTAHFYLKNTIMLKTHVDGDACAVMVVKAKAEVDDV